MAEEVCRFYINEQISGSPHEWPMEWFKRVRVSEPFPLGLSVGCGDGALERDVRRKEICREVVGVDISAAALDMARRQAADEGLSGITYTRGDFNRFELPPGKYDIVFVHQAMHHVAELEHCVAQLARTLVGDGILYLDEYVGPSRTDWNEARLAAANEVYASLPASLRPLPRLPMPIHPNDPSEAIRSSEIVPVVSSCFEVLERRDYGGNLLALLTPYIRWDQLDETGRDELLRDLIAREKEMLRAGEASFHTLILATPKPDPVG